MASGNVLYARSRKLGRAKGRGQVIDPRVHYVGTSYLRKLNATRLRNLGDELYVIQCPEPVQVLIGYDHFMRIQATIERLQRECAVKEERDGN